MNIEIPYPIWTVLLCLILGGVYSFLFYRQEKLFKDAASWQIIAMAAFRFFSVSILAFLLLTPLVTVEEQEVEKPLVVYLQDESESIRANQDSLFYLHEWGKRIDQELNLINEKYEVRKFSFGGKLSDSIQSSFTKKQTNISDAINEVYQRYEGRNIGAVILATDGIYNLGSNPLYTAEKINHVPFYLIALGDTSVRKDLAIGQVVVNDLAYKGNDFPVQVILKSQQVAPQKLHLSIYNNGKLITTKDINADEDKSIYTVDFVLPADDIGRQKYLVKVDELEKEVTYENNSTAFYIDVIENKQQILLLAKSPHPDIGAIKNSILTNKNYDLTLAYSEGFDGNFKPYNLVILHQLPSDDGENWADKALKEKKSTWFILGGETSINRFNNLKSGLNLIGSIGVTDAKAKLNENFVQFSTDDLDSKEIPKYPPLSIPMSSKYQLAGNATTIFYQQVGNTVTNFPLLSYLEKDEYKVSFLLGEGIWRWRMKDYVTNQNFNSFDQIILKTVQYLSAKEDKKRFKVFTKPSYLENEEVIFSAELFNKSYELINDPEVTLKLSKDQLEFPEKIFSKTGKSYRLNLGLLEPGEYSYKASVTLGNEFFEETGKLLIKEIKIEYAQLQANHHLLYQLANLTKGNVFFPNAVTGLSDKIIHEENIVDIIYSTKKTDDLIRYKWIFFVIISLLTLEWISRKRLGAY